MDIPSPLVSVWSFHSGPPASSDEGECWVGARLYVGQRLILVTGVLPAAGGLVASSISDISLQRCSRIPRAEIQETSTESSGVEAVSKPIDEMVTCDRIHIEMSDDPQTTFAEFAYHQTVFP